MWLGLINVLWKDSKMKCRGQLITSLKIRTIGFAIRVQREKKKNKNKKTTKDQVCYSNIRETEDSREG